MSRCSAMSRYSAMSRSWCRILLALTLLVSFPAASFSQGEAKKKAPGGKPSSAKRVEAKTAEAKTVEAKTAEDYGFTQVALINRQIREGWAGFNMRPSKAATDGEWCRRVYLDIIGRVPTVPEFRAFEKNRSHTKKSALVSQLLSEDYAEEYTRNWTTIWTNILIGRGGGQDNDSLTNREGMQKYLRDSIFRNKSYDRMVGELVSATGTTKPGTPDFNGATNFLADKLAEDGAQATAKTAQVLLGLQIQCTQCHNHPFNDWKQNRYWELNAFFRQTRALRTFAAGTRDVKGVELANEDFAGQGDDPAEAEIYYELRNGLLKVAYPVFVDGSEISKSGYLEDVVRREKLSQLIVSSEWMPKVMVNRMWGHFLGYGFTKPVDDLGPHNPPSHPVLLDALAVEFAKHSFDVKKLIRWITLSEAYSLSSRGAAGNKADDPLLGEQPKFTHFYLRQMRAEELYESLITATRADKTRGTYEQQEAAKQKWMAQFIIAFGTDEGDETTTFNGTIPQNLMMMNGELIKRACNNEKGSFLHTIATSSKLNKAQKINYLFNAALSRGPSSRETQIANRLLTARDGNTAAALQDMWWAILNSNEFILNH